MFIYQQEPQINLRDELKNVEKFLIVSTWFYTMINRIFIIIIFIIFYFSSTLTVGYSI